MFFCRWNKIQPNYVSELFMPSCYNIPPMYILNYNSNMNRKDYNQVQSTQVNQIKSKYICKRTSQCISRNKGSVTVEAALVLPFFLFVLYAILLISQFLMTEDRIQGALVETGRVLAGEEEVTLSRARLELSKQVKTHNLSMVSGGAAGISLKASKLPNHRHEIELHAEYHIKVSIPFLFTITAPVRVTVIQRMFDGYHDGDGSLDEGGAYVYVAEHESVYHTNAQCSHIAIRLVPVTDTSALAGKRQCEGCKKYHRVGEYVTLAGDCIHQNPQCSKIKRTVYMLDKEKLGGLPLCNRCAKKG